MQPVSSGSSLSLDALSCLSESEWLLNKKIAMFAPLQKCELNEVWCNHWSATHDDDRKLILRIFILIAACILFPPPAWDDDNNNPWSIVWTDSWRKAVLLKRITGSYQYPCCSWWGSWLFWQFSHQKSVMQISSTKANKMEQDADPSNIC